MLTTSFIASHPYPQNLIQHQALYLVMPFLSFNLEHSSVFVYFLTLVYLKSIGQLICRMSSISFVWFLLIIRWLLGVNFWQIFITEVRLCPFQCILSGVKGHQFVMTVCVLTMVAVIFATMISSTFPYQKFGIWGFVGRCADTMYCFSSNISHKVSFH